MKVVDGEAKGNHDTPMFVRTMRYMIFRPYWNLPVSIIKKELVNHLSGAGGAATAGVGGSPYAIREAGSSGQIRDDDECARRRRP